MGLQLNEAAGLDMTHAGYKGSTPALTDVMVEIDGEARFLRRGDRIGDWELLSIRDRDITFGSGDQRRVLQLPVHSATPPDAVPGRPTAPAPPRRPSPPPSR